MGGKTRESEGQSTAQGRQGGRRETHLTLKFLSFLAFSFPPFSLLKTFWWLLLFVFFSSKIFFEVPPPHFVFY